MVVAVAIQAVWVDMVALVVPLVVAPEVEVAVTAEILELPVQDAAVEDGEARLLFPWGAVVAGQDLLEDSRALAYLAWFQGLAPGPYRFQKLDQLLGYRPYHRRFLTRRPSRWRNRKLH